jgi:hypothetical protein
MRFKTILAAAFLATVTANGFAQDRFGLGLILGEPTGLSVKYWLDEENAIDGAAAWSFSDNDSFQLHGDYLWHNYNLVNSDEFSGKLPVYYGVGARLKFKDDNGHHDDEAAFGIRVPFGISYLFENAPFDLFAELVPILDLTPDTDLELSAAIGVRFYFE